MMNEELIKQCARDWAAQDRERAASCMRGREAEANELTAADRYRAGKNDALLSREIELLRDYHARAVAPLEQENAELRALVAELTERAKADGERIGRLEASVAPLVEAATKVCARWSFYDDTTLMADLRTALAPLQQEARDAAD